MTIRAISGHRCATDFQTTTFWGKPYHWKSLSNNGAPGVDGVSCQDIVDGPGATAVLQKRHGELRTKRYKPQPVLRVCIPKSDAGKRPLGSSPRKKSRDRQEAKDDPMLQNSGF